MPIKIKSEIERLVLMTLSFFEQMTFSQIILDFDKDLIKNFSDFDKEQLQETLNTLEKKKLIKRVSIDKEIGWIRIHPPKKMWKKIYQYVQNLIAL